jgi:AraC-like DNA-binding protein
LSRRRAGAFVYRFPTNIPGIEAVCVSGGPNTRWSELHRTFTVCTVERGAPVSYRCHTGRHERSPRVGMLVGPDELHADEGVPEQSVFRILRIAPRALAGVATRLGIPYSNMAVAEREIASARANDRFLALHRELESSPESPRVSRLLDLCVVEILRRCTARARAVAERPEITRAHDYIRDHLAEPMTLGEIARATGSSRWRLSALFRRHVGVPPVQYAMQLRVACARAWLAMGRPCGEIASDAGFCDQSHLNRWFRRVYGVTPGEYQTALLASLQPRPIRPAGNGTCWAPPHDAQRDADPPGGGSDAG